MIKPHYLIKKRTIFTVLLLCLVTASVLYCQDKERVRKLAHHPDGIWTITMENEETSYTFRGPLDMFLIHRSLVTNHRKLTADVNRLSMEWDYESGQPWRRWARENHKSPQWKDRVKLSAKVKITSAAKDTAAHAESIYLDRVINSSNPAENAKLTGKVWNDTALKFEKKYETYFLIEKREPYDGRVISCRDGTKYCGLYGARVNYTLELNDINVLQEDVMNWKQYQDKARSLVQQVIVE